MDVLVNMLGKMDIEIENKKIEIVQNKPRAVLFYILYKKSCSREELLDLFWSNLTEEKARANLRNVLYRIRHTLQEDLIVANGNETLKINSRYNLIRDIDVLLDTNNTKYLEIEDFEFLKNHGVKSCPNFDDWVEELRRVYKNLILNTMTFQISHIKSLSENSHVERICKKIIKLDPYNEQAYRILIKQNMENYNFDEALRLSKEIKNKINAELDSPLEEETEHIIEELNSTIAIKKSYNKRNIFVRESYIQEFLKEIDKFMKGEPYKHCIFSGDWGVGKSQVIENVLKKQEKIQLIKIDLHLEEYKDSYMCLYKIFREIDRESIDIILKAENSFEYMLIALKQKLERLYINKKIFIQISDLQYIDQKSLRALKAIFFEENQHDFFLVGEYNVTFEKNNNYLKDLSISENVNIISVRDLSFGEFEEYYYSRSKEKNPNYNSGDMSLDRIYKETKGNFIFINNCVDFNNGSVKKYLDVNIVEKLKSNLSPNEILALNYLALNNGILSSLLLRCILKEYEVNHFQNIDMLISSGLVQIENKNGIEYVKIKSPLLSRSLLKNLSKNKKEELATKIIDIMEENRDKWSIEIYEYYLKNKVFFSEYIEDKLILMKNKLDYLEYLLNYYDEFYPHLGLYSEGIFNRYLNKEQVYESFEDIEKNLYKYNITQNNQETYFKLYFLKGRSLIRDGYNEEGQKYIDKLIRNVQNKDRKLLMKAYFEKVYLGLRIGNPTYMKKYLKKIHQINKYEKNQFVAIKIVRLMGFSEFLMKNYQKSILIYDKAIKMVLNLLPERDYAFNIGSLYNYKAMSHCYIKDYNMAQIYHKKAINICKKYGITKSLDEFYKDYAYSMYLKGDFETSETLCIKSRGIYEKYTGFWERSMIYILLALINLEKNNFEMAKEYNNIAQIYISKNPSAKEIFLNKKFNERFKELKEGQSD
ncbi:MAG: hypothetical protein Q4D95_05155 [Peptoniphilus sp.]|nr:hypothetical protein [Peptoniphilus sp.]